ncbi:MAG TPA: sensor histidine kinase [Bacillota bacterium]|nr:sensor histidine kinase [Bacillota bacterium]
MMERKTEQALTIAKFTAYAGVLAAIVLNPVPRHTLSLGLWVALLVSGSIRHFVLSQYGSCEDSWAPLSFLIDIIVGGSLARLGYGGLDIVIYFIVISESTISGRTSVGIIATVLSAAALWFGRVGLWSIQQTLLYVGINGAALLFALTVSLAIKREASRRVELQDVLIELETSRDQLEATYNELRESQLRLQDMAITEERARMAREIHDTLAHSMTAIVVTLEAARRRLSRGDTAIDEDLARAQDQARQGLDEVRRSVTQLRPTMLSPGNLSEALALLLSQVEKWHNVATELVEDGSPLPLTHLQEAAIYRLVQEAATNAVRHGRCSRVTVGLQSSDGEIRLTVADDGKGADQFVWGNGLTGMNERLAEFGGKVDFVSQPGEGFTVIATLPFGEVQN